MHAFSVSIANVLGIPAKLRNVANSWQTVGAIWSQRTHQPRPQPPLHNFFPSLPYHMQKEKEIVNNEGKRTPAATHFVEQKKATI